MKKILLCNFRLYRELWTPLSVYPDSRGGIVINDRDTTNVAAFDVPSSHLLHPLSPPPSPARHDLLKVPLTVLREKKYI